MTSPDLAKAATELLERTRAAQGLPPKVTDPATLQRVAAVLRAATGSDRAA